MAEYVDGPDTKPDDDNVGPEVERANVDQVVEYIGPADYRVITEEDWQKAGVDAEAEAVQVIWSVDNENKVKRSDLEFLSDEQFDRIIRADKGFRIY